MSSVVEDNEPRNLNLSFRIDRRALDGGAFCVGEDQAVAEGVD